MSHEVVISGEAMNQVRTHLFQSDLEQAAFLFASVEEREFSIRFIVSDYYLVPKSGWDVQMNVYLEMSEAERARILKLARDRNAAIIDCHSHPQAGRDVWFSPSDSAGISDFAQYVRWKLDGKPFAALVWGEQSVDGVVWRGDFHGAEPLGAVVVEGRRGRRLRPTGSWFRNYKQVNRFSFNER
jgi:hypothetical protein